MAINTTIIFAAIIDANQSWTSNSTILSTDKINRKSLNQIYNVSGCTINHDDFNVAITTINVRCDPYSWATTIHDFYTQNKN